MRFAVLLMAVCLSASPFAGARHKAAAAKASHSSSSTSSGTSKSARTTARGRHGRTRAHSSRRSYQAAPTPERYQEIQQALAGKGYYKGPVNGQWGPDSVDALKRFQTEQKLPADGKLNSLSLIAMGLGPKRDPVTNVAQPNSNPTETTPAESAPNDHRSPEGSQRP